MPQFPSFDHVIGNFVVRRSRYAFHRLQQEGKEGMEDEGGNENNGRWEDEGGKRRWRKGGKKNNGRKMKEGRKIMEGRKEETERK